MHASADKNHCPEMRDTHILAQPDVSYVKQQAAAAERKNDIGQRKSTSGKNQDNGNKYYTSLHQ